MKKRNSADIFGLQRVPRDLTLKVKPQGHRMYCDTCPVALILAGTEEGGVMQLPPRIFRE